MRSRGNARRAGRAVRRGTTLARLTRWRLIRAVALILGAFVAFNGITGLIGHRPDASEWITATVVVALGVAVWRVGARLAGPRPR